jgi:small-conductance mechanosensitive channel
VDWDWLAPAIAAFVVVVLAVLGVRATERFFDRHVAFAPEARTRFRAFARTIEAVIVVVAVLTALLAIPGIQAIVSAVLASSALLAAIIGFAARPTIGNFVSGLAIALAQPIRIGDDIEIAGVRGRVGEIGRTYSTMSLADGSRLLVPNERLSTDAIRNFTIAASERSAIVRVPVPLGSDLEAALALVAEEAASAPEATAVREPAVRLEEIGSTAAVVALELWAADAATAERLAVELRLRIHRRLRERGIYSG